MNLIVAIFHPFMNSLMALNGDVVMSTLGNLPWCIASLSLSMYIFNIHFLSQVRHKSSKLWCWKFVATHVNSSMMEQDDYICIIKHLKARYPYLRWFLTRWPWWIHWSSLDGYIGPEWGIVAWDTTKTTFKVFFGTWFLMPQNGQLKMFINVCVTIFLIMGGSTGKEP